MDKTAAFLGRFQPFHCGHLSIVTKILESYEHLILIIGSPDESGTMKNPWTAQEREEIMRAMIPLELQEKIDIISLSDDPSDDVWGENLKCIIDPLFEGFESGAQPNGGCPALSGTGGFMHNKSSVLRQAQDSSFKKEPTCVLFTGNEWTRDIALRVGITVEWITYSIDISATQIRERLGCGEDVSEFTIVKSLPLLPSANS